MKTCPTEQEHRWKLRPDGHSYVCVLCDEQRYELASASTRAVPEHDWQFYGNGTFCRRCGTAIGSGYPCR